MSSGTTIFYLAFVFLISASTILYSSTNKEEQFPALKDTIGNITDVQQAFIKNVIKNAESKFNSTNFEGIADYISLNIQDTANQLKWNVYAYEGTIKQIAFDSTSIYWNKYMLLVNYGRYGITYLFLMYPQFWCSYKYQMTGGSSLDQFSQSVTESEKQMIMGVIENAITFQGNNIMANANYIQQKLHITIKNNWAIIIADPNARYGYHICRSSNLKWFALRQFKNFKWNYFGSNT